MDRGALLKEISGTLVKADIERLSTIICESKFPVGELLNLTFYPQKETAFRAAWILEHLVLTDLDNFRPYIVKFLDCYPKQANQSCRRHFAKILANLTAPKHVKKYLIPEMYSMDCVVEKTFEWLIDPKTPVAVKVYCMEGLFNLKKHAPWIREELEAEIIFLLHDGGAALQSRGKAILKKLSRT
ncbi:MAG TPA: hypothetical protein VLZ28_07995 [Daejeonella sp.]|nr:hypothetical protein [Daejeonella sp.]